MAGDQWRQVRAQGGKQTRDVRGTGARLEVFQERIIGHLLVAQAFGLLTLQSHDFREPRTKRGKVRFLPRGCPLLLREWRDVGHFGHQ